MQSLAEAFSQSPRLAIFASISQPLSLLSTLPFAVSTLPDTAVVLLAYLGRQAAVIE